jgi:hypothetical protein
MPRCVTLDPYLTKTEPYARHCQSGAPVERSPLPNCRLLVGSDRRPEQRLSMRFDSRRTNSEICRREAVQCPEQITRATGRRPPTHRASRCYLFRLPSLTTVLTTAPSVRGGRPGASVDERVRRSQEMPGSAHRHGRQRTGGGEFDSPPSPPPLLKSKSAGTLEI